MNTARNDTNDEIAALLRGSEEERYEGLRHLFEDEKLEQIVLGKIKSMGGSKDDAWTAYQEGFIRFSNHVLRGSFRGESAPSTFFIGICINCWKQNRRQSWNNRVTLTDDPGQHDTPVPSAGEESQEDEHWRRIAMEVLALTSEECGQILLEQAKGARLKDIAQRLGIKEESLKNKIFRCRENIRRKAESMPGFAERIKNILRGL